MRFDDSPNEISPNSAVYSLIPDPDAACPGSLRPGWRTPLCGSVFRVFREQKRGCSSVAERPVRREVKGSILFSFSKRLAQWVEHETVNLAVGGSNPPPIASKRSRLLGSRSLLRPMFRFEASAEKRSGRQTPMRSAPSRIPLRGRVEAIRWSFARPSGQANHNGRHRPSSEAQAKARVFVVG